MSGLTPIAIGYRRPLSDNSRGKPEEAKGHSVTKLFEGIEVDINEVQSRIDQVKPPGVQSKEIGVYRGKLQSRRAVTPLARQLASLSGDTSLSIQQLRNSSVTDSIYSIVSLSLGQDTARLPNETCIRMFSLKCQLQDILLKKLHELAALQLIQVEGELQPTPLKSLLKLIDSKAPLDDSRVSRGEDTVTLQANLAEAKVVAAEALSKLHAAEASCIKHTERLKQLTAAHSVLEAQITKLKTEVEAKSSGQESAASTAKALTEQLAKHAEEVKAKDARFAELSAGHKAALLQIESLTDQVVTLTKQVDGLTKQLQSLQSAENSFADALNKANSTGAQAAAKAIELESQLSKIKSSADQLEKTVKQQNSLILAKEQQIKDADFLLSKAKAEVAELTDKIQRRDREGSSRNDQIIAACKQVEELLKIQLAEAEETIGKLEQTKEKLQQSILAQSRQLKSMQDELESLKRLDNYAFPDVDEDTFEAVMKAELTMMRNSYEAQLKSARADLDELKRKSYNELRELRNAARDAESQRDVAIKRLSAYTSH